MPLHQTINKYIKYNKFISCAGAMAQSVKRFATQHEDPSLDPRYLCEKQVYTATPTSNVGAGDGI